MGPNGSGKSTLANTIMGHPAYEVTDGRDHLRRRGHHRAGAARARQGRPLPRLPVPGLDPRRVGRQLPAHGDQRQARGADPGQGVPHAAARTPIELLDVDRAFTSRHLNDGFSGGEKKRAEILQMAMLAPGIAILDETDSGLDIDALRTVAEGVAELARRAGPGRADHHPLPAHPPLRDARVRPHPDGRPDRDGGRRRAGRAPRARGLRPDPRGGRGSRCRRAHAATPPSGRRAAQARAARSRGDALPRARRARRRRRRRSRELRERARAAYERARAAELAALGLLDDQPRGPRPRRAGDPHRRGDRDAGAPRDPRRRARAPPACCVQRDGSVVHTQLDPALAERGRDPLLARAGGAASTRELFERYYMRRLSSTATSWRPPTPRSGAAAHSSTCHPAWPSRSRSRSSTRSAAPAARSTRTRSRSATAAATFACTSTTLAEDATSTRAGAARRRVRALPARTARAAASPSSPTGAHGEVYDVSTRRRRGRSRRLLPLAAGAARRAR